MNDNTADAVLGCMVWFAAIIIITSCTLHFLITFSLLTSFIQSAIAFAGNFVCLCGVVPAGHTYETTKTDEFDDEEPATGIELHCIDQNGKMVKNDSGVYTLLWIGFFVLIGLVISGILLFMPEPKIDKFITWIVKRRHKQDIATNVLPL